MRVLGLAGQICAGLGLCGEKAPFFHTHPNPGIPPKL